mgnify:CR=1 FL=1
MLKRGYIPAILWSLFIASSCLLPASSFHRFSLNSLFELDKLIHLILYFVLVVLWAISSGTNYGANKKFIIVLMSIAYGVLIELLQAMMGMGRAYDLDDIIANTVGCILGILSVSFVSRNMPLFKKYLPFLRYLY